MSDYFMPAEWAPQTSIWLSWPHRDDQWEGDLITLQNKFGEIAATISRFQQVDINAAADLHATIESQFVAAGGDLDHFRMWDHPTNDVWCRDHGPVFVKSRADGSPALLDWGFNAWGGKFPPYDLDNAIPSRIAEALNLPKLTPGMILEGGSIEVNSQGQVLTTEAVLLNPNRNPELDKDQIEARLKTFLGVREVLWLRAGIEGDDTDGHIDDLTRFVNDDTLITVVDPGGVNEAVLSGNLARLESFRTVDGRPFVIHTIALPEACQTEDWRLPHLPASYVNFLIINGAVLVPQFRQPENDKAALEQIGKLFPDRKAIGIDCLDLVKEGGSLHCISQQQPA
ncbi:agmatine deiminase family protein [Verrucomicrobiales bacterium BCK34]|nr:agmatine deiminase family protein [Verrucomicrobiales bacterium BCK34]